MNITEIRPNVFYIKYKTQYDACMAFVRVQEFYESPYKSIRGKSFTLEEYMDVYAKDRGHFDYDKVWNGFNVPSTTVDKFLKVCKPLRLKEIQFLKSFIPKLQKGKFYLIAGADDRIVTHETAHAYYYLSAEYKKEMKCLIDRIPPLMKASYCEKLLKNGYCHAVLEDELQAYFVDSAKYKKDLIFKKKLCPALTKLCNQFYEVFKKYDDKKAAT